MMCMVDHLCAPCPGPYGKCDCHMPKGTCCENCKGRAPLYGEYCTWSSCPCHQASEEKVKNLIRERLDDPELIRKAAVEGAKDQDAMIPTVEEATKGLREAGYKVDHVASPLVGDWESDFRKIGAGSVRFMATREEVITFIRSLLLRVREETVGIAVGAADTIARGQYREGFKAGKAEVVRELKGQLTETMQLLNNSTDTSKCYISQHHPFEAGRFAQAERTLKLLDSLVDRTEI